MHFPLFPRRPRNTISSGPSYDPDAVIFFNAAGNDLATILYTDLQAKNAVNTWIVYCKDMNLWSQYDAMYLTVGGTASKNAINAKNPGTYDLTFYGGWTHSAEGIQGNGITSYADTGISPSSMLGLNNAHVSIYTRTNTDGAFCDIGQADNNDEINIFSKFAGIFYPRVNGTNGGISNTLNSLRLFISNRINNTQVRAYQDGILKLITNASSGRSSTEINIGCLNRPIVGRAFYSSRQYCFASVGKGLTDQNMADMTTGVNALQASLFRNV